MFFAEGFINRGIFVSKRTGNQPRHCVDHDCSRQFAARQYKIADGDFIRREMFGHAFIHTFIAPADEYDAVELREPARCSLIEKPARRR